MQHALTSEAIYSDIIAGEETKPVATQLTSRMYHKNRKTFGRLNDK